MSRVGVPPVALPGRIRRPGYR